MDKRRRMFIPTMGGGAAAAASYATVLQDTYGASEVWPLVDISSGTNIPAFINSNRDGTLTGWDLQNAAGPVTGTLAPYSDGVNDSGNILTSNGSDGLADIYNGDVCSFFMWAKVYNSGIWTNGLMQFILFTRGDSTNNRIRVFKGTGNNTLSIYINSGGIQKNIDTTTSTTGWFSVGISLNNGEFKAFFNGSQTGSTQTGLGAWVGPLGFASVGDAATTYRFNGWLSYTAVKFGSIWSPTDFANMHNAAATAGAD